MVTVMSNLTTKLDVLARNYVSI